ncbi:hypothetical protein SAMN05216317_101190 [Nitrosomonas eutropha]|uniref:c-type cytochrome n=1 Tax=Nitrosomonas TaxID=914 RepID=UPI000898AB9D|nr:MULTISPECIES: hypothetical protein [Nitrosomonas]MXS79898.1 hypothetical protein [Nitrosomonas sp. GH22]SDW03271.1 hypothetical protein SAMN05216317_101190 [Nitrosomonas eutropha]
MKTCRNILYFTGISLVLLLAGCSDDLSLKIAADCIKGNHAQSGTVLDEAQCVNRSAESFPGADEDYFKDMDYGISQIPDKVVAALEPFVPGISRNPDQAVQSIVKGRNNWIVWTGGNDKFWDYMNAKSFGSFDLLKVLSNHPGLVKKPGYSRDNRWNWFGLVNEPCFMKNTDAQGKLIGREDRFGLYLDVRDSNCPADPFENEEKYPGVKIGARGKTVPVGSYYGYATGIVGLRLFPNPDFDEAAKKHWNAEKYYSDPDYYNDPKLVKPYRVGMACGFCHVGPNPTNPPKDPENPQWANLNSNPGAQYFWFDRVFAYEADKTSFAYQHLHTNRPGALDTSLISTDYINNPRTMNAVYSLPARMLNALRWGEEKLNSGERNNKQFNHFKEIPADSPLRAFFKDPDTVLTPRVLKDGADSVGALGALNRVFVNIGLFSEEWLQHINPLVGGKPFTPFPIKIAEQNSSYWRATEQQTLDGALFFLAATPPDHLKDVPGDGHYLIDDEKTLERGKQVFAENCAACHSSKLPEQASEFFPDNGCVGPNYLNCWNEYWHWTNSSEFKEQMTKLVMEEDFLKENFLSTELRIPVTLLETNICASIATNAIKGDTWDNFSSTTYKQLPSVGEVLIHHPVTREPVVYAMPDGGRGYIRPPSLTSIWSTAPFLLNNTVGKFYPSGSVEDRMKSFQISIEQLLWPEKRYCDQKDLYYYEHSEKEKDSYAYDSETTNSCEGKTYLTQSGKEIPGIIDRTTERSELKIPKGYLPWYVSIFPIGDGLELGPFPAGIPVNLISNTNMEMNWGQRLSLSWDLVSAIGWNIFDLWKAQENPESITDEELRKMLSGIVDPLLAVNKCPDFVVNRGHYFGTDYLPAEEGRTALDDSDKHALIEFLKTM